MYSPSPQLGQVGRSILSSWLAFAHGRVVAGIHVCEQMHRLLCYGRRVPAQAAADKNFPCLFFGIAIDVDTTADLCQRGELVFWTDCSSKFLLTFSFPGMLIMKLLLASL